jgi:F-type H+-transporting ATPase subunit delta
MAGPAKVYAAAFYEVAKKKDELKDGLGSLKEFADLCSGNPILKAVLMGEGIEPRSRSAILKDLLSAMKIDGIAARLLTILVARGRAVILPEVIRELETIQNLEAGIKSGVVKTAVELGVDEIENLGKTLSKRAGGQVHLRSEVDPALLGGFIATVDGKTYDASLRSQMNRIRRELI